MLIGYVFPGQGDQHINMFDCFFEIEELGKEFDLISNCIGEDIKDIEKWSKEKSIFKNETAQILMVGYSVILKKLFLDMNFSNPKLCIGYSVGEISANLFGNTISSDEALRMAVNRSKIMNMSINNGVEQGLLSIRGINLINIKNLIDSTGNYLSILNGRDHFLVGGYLKSINNLEFYLREYKSIKITKINVSVASHTPLMNESEKYLYDYLDCIKWEKSEVNVLSGLDGRSILNKKEFKNKFSKQISNPINWMDCISRVLEQGVDLLVEIGPGKSMKNIIINNDLGINVRSINDFKSLEGFGQYMRSRFYS